MSRPIILFSGGWADTPLEELTQKASEWGYQGLELCCWGDHLDIAKAHAEAPYCQQKLDLLGRHDLTAPVISCHRVSQAVCDVVDERHRPLLPEHVWGDGRPTAVQQRAADEVKATIRA